MIDKIEFKDKSPSFYKHYPKLFANYFNQVSERHIDFLSRAGYHYYHSVLCLDAIIDDGVFEEIPKMTTLQEESIKLLTSVFGLESQFWIFWNRRKKEYFEAVKIEKSLSNLDSVDFRMYQDLADKKSAFGKVAIDSLYTLQVNKDDDMHKKLLLSHKYFSTGFQLYDDVKDFKEDFEKGQFNFAIEQLRQEVNFDQHGNNVKILNKLLFIKEIGQEILSKSISQFETAITILKGLSTKSEWLTTVLEMKATIENYLDISNGYLATITAKIELKNQQSCTYAFFDFNEIDENATKNGLAFIKSDFQQNYADLKHVMYLGNLEGFDNENTIHISDTFQRALINECFIAVANAYNLGVSNFLKNECQYLISIRNKDSVGGWSYLPTVQEIAADIDDLGQIIQLFVLSRNQQFIDVYCNRAISIALKERMLENGGIETWIIPAQYQTRTQKRQEHFNAIKWGKGPDVEVVANFVYSLTILDKDKYAELIKKAISYVIGQQDDKGYWESRWYYGNYYGTYVCLRLLKQFEEFYPIEIQKALGYIAEGQNNDGGFSIEQNKASDPLSTALAILGLKVFYDKNCEVIEKAVTYLTSSQSGDGSWKAVDFIKPKIHEPYKSKTLTTAYVLKALCK
jgi:hypothetical protein